MSRPSSPSSSPMPTASSTPPPSSSPAMSTPPPTASTPPPSSFRPSSPPPPTTTTPPPSSPRPSSPRTRPSRPPRPSFFLNNDGSEDDFFQGPSRAVTPFPPTDDPALIPLPSDSASTTDPTESSHSPPLIAPQAQPFLLRQHPPSSFFPDPYPPFARPTRPFTEASRTSSAHSFAAPPLPWLRDSNYRNSSASPSATGTDGHLTPRRKAFTSTLLTTPVDKPWLSRKDPRARAAQWLTRALFLLGVAAAAVIVFFGFRGIDTLPPVCLLMEDNFDSGSIDPSIWTREVELGGFGNGEFQWYTADGNNSFIQSNQLHIVPTLTSDVLPESAIFNGYHLTLPDCTSPTKNKTACSTSSSDSAGTVIPPVRSARLSTRASYSMRYGRVEVRAKMPRGDWLWPAIWMLPVNETYGPWPMSGEIDIAEARGNGLDYRGGGSNFVSSTLNWGPTTTINAWTKTWGWLTQRRESYGSKFHTYAVEWTPDFMRFYVDTRIQSTLSLSFRKKSFFERGDFPLVIQAGAQEAVLQNPWAGQGNDAPFDQPFYLILNVAAGGTNGWFPDGVGNKPWVDNSASAMRDFAFRQNEWAGTWEDGMVVDWVKMWTLC